MLGCFCLAELDLVIYCLLNKIQFTFEVVPCLILCLFRQFLQRRASILAQRYIGVGWVGGKEERVGVGGGEGGGKKP